MAWSRKDSELSNYDESHENIALEARDNIDLADNFYYDEITTTTKNKGSSRSNSSSISDSPENKQLAIVSANSNYPRVINGEEDGEYEDEEDIYRHHKPKSLIDYSWSRKILEMVGNKAKLVESFSWLSTVGGGFSALGEKDTSFSMRAGSLSLGQQLQLAELLGDDRLKVMCHLFAALAALQLDNKLFCVKYMRRVAVPLLSALPYRDPILMNMVKHIFFRLGVQNRRDCREVVVNAIKDKSDHAKK